MPATSSSSSYARQQQQQQQQKQKSDVHNANACDSNAVLSLTCDALLCSAYAHYAAGAIKVRKRM